MISLALIARNEARCLERCLRSAAPYVDEMLVVDTGSTDGTPDIARTCGARVRTYAWNEDFAAARNFALSCTDADWILVLDADEWIESGGPALRLATATAAAPFVGQFTIRNAYDDGDTVRYAPSWLSRLLPRGVLYEGRVHEQPVHRLSLQRLPLVVGHDGYRRAQQAGKRGRNEGLLRRLLAERPGDPYVQYQLGKDLELQARFAQASDCYGAARVMLGWPPGESGAGHEQQRRLPWLHDLVVRNLYCLKRAGAYGPGQALALAQQPWWDHSPDFHFACADLLLDVALADPRQAPELLPRMEAHWLRCLELGENPNLEGAVEGRGSHLAAHNLALLRALQAGSLPGT